MLSNARPFGQSEKGENEHGSQEKHQEQEASEQGYVEGSASEQVQRKITGRLGI